MALELGSQGDAVMRVQQALIDQGFDPGPVDARFGPGTENAVRAFQTNRGLAVDGIVGDATWSALGLPGSVPKPVSFD